MPKTYKGYYIAEDGDIVMSYFDPKAELGLSFIAEHHGMFIYTNKE